MENREREGETGERRAEMRCGGGYLRDDGAHDGEEKVTEDWLGSGEGELA